MKIFGKDLSKTNSCSCILQDRINNPDKYQKIKAEKSKKYWAKKKIEDKIRDEQYNEGAKYDRKAIGLKNNKPVTLRMHWMQPYDNHGWWVVSFNSVYWEVPPYSDGYMASRSIDDDWYGHSAFSGNYKRAGFKRATCCFDSIKQQFLLREDISSSESNFKKYFGIDVKECRW